MELDCGSRAAAFLFWRCRRTFSSESLLSLRVDITAYSAQFWRNASSLESTLMDSLVSVESKGFAETLSPL
jgi:hypothetical protein